MSQQINLYQAEFRPNQVLLPTTMLLRGLALWVVGLAVVYAYDAWQLNQTHGDLAGVEQRVLRLESQLTEMQSRLAGQGADEALVKQAEAVEARLHALSLAHEAIQQGALGSEQGYAEHFRALGRAIVPDVWLTGIRLQGREPALSLDGRTLEGDGPARFVQGLRREPYFRGLNFAALVIERPATQPGPVEAQATPGKDAGMPRYLEFSLRASLSDTAEGATANTPAAPGSVR